MKSYVGALFLGLILAVALATSTAAFAQEVSRTVTIKRDSKLGDQTLSKGTYTVKFAEGKDGEAVFIRGKREVAKTSYKMTKLSAAPSDTLVVSSNGVDGSYKIKRIEFKGLRDALVLE